MHSSVCASADAYYVSLKVTRVAIAYSGLTSFHSAARKAAPLSVRCSKHEREAYDGFKSYSTCRGHTTRASRTRA